MDVDGGLIAGPCARFGLENEAALDQVSDDSVRQALWYSELLRDAAGRRRRFLPVEIADQVLHDPQRQQGPESVAGPGAFRLEFVISHVLAGPGQLRAEQDDAPARLKPD